MNIWINVVYLLSSVAFIYGLKLMSSPATAKRGNLISSGGMAIAVLATLMHHQILHYGWIILGLVIGTAVGIPAALTIQMTAMPEMVALLNGFGGISSLLLGWATYHHTRTLDGISALTVLLSVLIGGLTFTGSIVAWGKLKGVINQKAVLFPGQKIINAGILGVLVLFGVIFCMASGAPSMNGVRCGPF